jgi:hypothetical protein
LEDGYAAASPFCGFCVLPGGGRGGPAGALEERNSPEEEVDVDERGEQTEKQQDEQTQDRDALFGRSGEAEDFRRRWSEIQVSFVDEPERSVEQADELVVDLTDQLVSSMRAERSQLEQRWSRDEEVTTEDLRVTLQRYRSFFDRLLETSEPAAPRR